MSKKYGLDIAYCNEVQKNLTMDEAREYYHNKNMKNLSFCCPDNACRVTVTACILNKPLNSTAGATPYYRFSKNYEHTKKCSYIHDYVPLFKDKKTPATNDKVNIKRSPIKLDVVRELIVDINNDVNDKRKHEGIVKQALNTKENKKSGKVNPNATPRGTKTTSFRNIVTRYLKIQNDSTRIEYIKISGEIKELKSWFVSIKLFDGTESCIVYSTGDLRTFQDEKSYFYPQKPIQSGYFKNTLTSIEVQKQKKITQKYSDVFFAFLYLKNSLDYKKVLSSKGKDKIVFNHKYFDFRQQA